MPLAVLIAVFLSVPGTAPSLSKLMGVWVLDRDQSDFGALDKPRQLLIRVEPADQSLAVWEITITREGRSLAYRHVHLRGISCSAEEPVAHAACWVEPDGGGTEETWQLSLTGELVITRRARIGVRTVSERIVLAPSTQGVE